METGEINKWLIYQIKNINNEVAVQIYGSNYLRLNTEGRMVVNGFVKNLILYNHYANHDENWNNNPFEKEGDIDLI
jgi:hypothetical protein